jgi:hypothetical protein
LALSAAAPLQAGEELTWRRRSLRAVPKDGYLAVVALEAGEGTPIRAALACEAEEIELGIDSGQWTVAGQATAGGGLNTAAPPTFFVKRTPTHLIVGAFGQWLYDREVEPTETVPSLRVGTGQGVSVGSFHVVPRTPVRFTDDFPDPEPQPGRWAPVRGRWALSSLTSPEHSANPAELAALFDSLDDAGSAGRMRHADVGVGMMLGGGPHPFVAQVAADSPSERAGLRRGDRITAIEGAEVNGMREAAARLGGEEGETVTLTVERPGEEPREVKLRRELIVWGRNRRQVILDPYRPEDVALITAGDEFWTDYRLACAVRLQEVGAVGLVFAYLDADNYHAFRWLGSQAVDAGPGRWQLERVRGGTRTVLANRTGGFWPRDFHSLSVSIRGDAVGEVAAVCSVDGNAVLEAADDGIVPGKIGLWAQAPGVVCFDDVAVVGHGAGVETEAHGTRSRVQRFDKHMKAWGNPAYAWQYDAMSSRWWHEEDWPGEVTLSSPQGAGDVLRLTVGATRGKADSGYTFELNKKSNQTVLSRSGTALAEKPLGDAKPERVALSRSGKSITVRFDGEPWLQATDPEPLRGSAVLVAGVPLSGFRPAAEVAVESPNAVEYYFNGAPRDWHVMHGYWEVMNRWICDPRWSFFGGRAEGVLAIWNRRRLEGDCFAELFIGPMMMDRSAQYENLRDLGLTICGDGRNLASGYTVLVGANGNQVTTLFRNGRIVASRRDGEALIPRHAFPSERTLYPSRHRGWVPITLARQGSSVRVYLFDRLVLSYEDPEPLEGGYTAVWSVRNGVLLAKVRLAASRISPPHLEPFLRQHTRFSDATLTNDIDGMKAAVERTGSAYAIRNAIGGGPFAVALRPRVYSAVQRPTVAFDIKLEEGARVDLYLTCRGELYRVVLTGPDGEDGGAETLGTADGVKADGKWHHVRFDLLAALREKHPDDPLLLVWEPRIANYATQGYLAAGFHGNAAGARYWLRDVSIEAEGQPPQISRRPADR